MKKAFIYTFKTYKNYYIYDFNTNAIIRVEKEVYDILNENRNELNARVNAVTEELQNRGFLQSHHWEYIEHPVTKYIHYYLRSSIKSITLQVTQQCNLRCGYCPYSGTYYNRKHNNKKMDFDLAKSIIDFYMHHSYDMPELQIGFYGGEPLIEFDLIERIIQYVNGQAGGKKVRYRMTTNATLLDKKMLEVLAENDVALVISLDGPKEYHDRNRQNVNGKGTFDIIMDKLDLISKEYPQYATTVAINCVIDPRNNLKYLDDFFKNNEFMKNRHVMFNKISREGIKDKESYLEDESYMQRDLFELFKLLYSKVEKTEGIDISAIPIAYYSQLKTLMSNRGISTLVEKAAHPGGPCIVGCHKLFVDIYGNFYPCERVSEVSPDMKIGNIKDGFYEEQVIKLLNIGRLTEKSCKECWAAKFCFLCAQHADTGNGISIKKKLQHCQGVKYEAVEQLKDYCLICENSDFDNDILWLDDIM